MKEWFTARELAGLSGLPTTRFGVALRATREGWECREREVRGGGLEYRLSSLPQATQAHLLRVHAPQPLAPERPSLTAEQAWQRYERSPKSMQQMAVKRASLLNTVEQFVARGTDRGQAIRLVAQEAHVTRGTIYRWFADVKDAEPLDWPAYLVPAYGVVHTTAEMPAEAWELFKGDYLRQEKPSATSCFRRLRLIANEQKWELPSINAFRRRLKREFSGLHIMAKREGNEALLRSYLAQTRDHSTLRALEAVNADGHRFDVFVRWPDGTIERPCMIAWHDIYSGKILSYRIDRTENKHQVRLALGDVIERFGIPEHAFLDNGRAFASKWLTGGTPTRYRFKVQEDDPLGLLPALNVQVHWCTPYHGQAKPVERAFKDLCDTVAKHPAFEGAYTGNNPTAKPENYGSKAVPLAEFMAVLEQEILHHNSRDGRRSGVCNGRSFDELFAESYAKGPVRKASQEQCRLWLLVGERLRASRQDGSVHLADNTYWCPEMGDLRGELVTVRFDPARLHSSVHVYTNKGAYVGEAKCVKAVGFMDQAAAQEHARARNAWKRAIKDKVNAEIRMSAADMAARLPKLQEAELPTPAVVQLSTFERFVAPKPAESQHDAATQAATARLITLEDERQRKRDEIKAQEEAWYKRYARCRKAFDAGQHGTLSADDVDWYMGVAKDPMFVGRYEVELERSAGSIRGSVDGA